MPIKLSCMKHLHDFKTKMKIKRDWLISNPHIGKVHEIIETQGNNKMDKYFLKEQHKSIVATGISCFPRIEYKKETNQSDREVSANQECTHSNISHFRQIKTNTTQVYPYTA